MHPASDDFTDRQREAWSLVAGGWHRRRGTISRATHELDDVLFKRAALSPGARVLEVGCGTGEVALGIARTVGPTGQVLAVDLSPEMLHGARERVRGMGLEQLEFREADAEVLDLGEHEFDAVICRWCIMLLAAPARAVKRIHELMKPGGRFACAVWGPPEDVPFLSLPRGIAVEFGAEVPPPDAPGPCRLGQPGALEELLQPFADVSVEDLTIEFSFGSPEEYLGFLVDCSTTTAALLAGERGEEIADRLVQATGEYRAENGRVVLPGQVRIGRGTR